MRTVRKERHTKFAEQNSMSRYVNLMWIWTNYPLTPIILIPVENHYRIAGNFCGWSFSWVHSHTHYELYNRAYFGFAVRWLSMITAKIGPFENSLLYGISMIHKNYKINCHIMGNFQGRKLWWISWFESHQRSFLQKAFSCHVAFCKCFPWNAYFLLIHISPSKISHYTVL